MMTTIHEPTIQEQIAELYRRMKVAPHYTGNERVFCSSGVRDVLGEAIDVDGFPLPVEIRDDIREIPSEREEGSFHTDIYIFDPAYMQKPYSRYLEDED